MEENNKSKKVLEVHKCEWVNQKGNPCPWKSITPERPYCEEHSEYEGIYTKKDIPNLSRCSGCKNLFKIDPEINKKTCTKCILRSKENRDKEKQDKAKNNKKCKGLTQNKTICTRDALENDDYCGKHQSYKKWKELVDSRKNVCKNWIRGCFEIINEDKKSCSKCRKKEQDCENKNNAIKKNKSIQYNEKNEKNKMCQQCNKIVIEDNIVNNKCVECYNSYCKIQNNRNPKDILLGRLSDYKKKCKEKNIKWELTDEEAINYFNSKCNYCNNLSSYNGIDRIDPEGYYIKENCVPCCKKCNIMKWNRNINDFLQIIKYILSINLIIDSKLILDDKKLFNCGNNAKYYRFICDAKNRNINCEITKEIYDFIINQPCSYCKNNFDNGCRGIDRIDSTLPYIMGNIAPCCYTCNMLKNVLNKDTFFEQLKKIYNFKILKIINKEEKTLKEQILELCKNVKPFEHEKFYYDHDYYKNLIFTAQNIDDVKKIKIQLEFVENKEQKDIWNYYRRYISSLKISKNSKLIGRQIHILVKDNITNKYLGILSFSSDTYSMESRDKYIGWSNEIKKENLKYIMNMSTCVSLQPFGFNFNGGKLIASLAFSKEVLSYFKEKYEYDDLLGITTTSLYGKSIQYDRLKNLKYLGNTKGHSSYKVPSEVTKLCNEFLKKEYNYNYELKKKFIILQKTFDILNLPKEDILSDNPKGIYFGFTYPESKKILKSIDIKNVKLTTTNIKSATEIFDWWIDRWAIQRYNNLIKNNNFL